MNIWANMISNVCDSKGIIKSPKEVQSFLKGLQINLHDLLFADHGFDFNDVEKKTKETNLDKEPEFQD